MSATPAARPCARQPKSVRAVTERFAFKTKYFYDEANREAFREEYAQMPLHEKAMENKPLVGGAALGVAVLMVVALVSFGLI